jgi:hypothetical protein
MACGEMQCSVPLSSFHPLPLELHIFRTERLPRRYRNADIIPLGICSIAAVHTALTALAGARVFAAACLL